jgi:iron(III) transport system permease protein
MQKSRCGKTIGCDTTGGRMPPRQVFEGLHMTTTIRQTNPAWNRFKTYIRQPQNAILVILGIVLTVSTIAPMVTIFIDTVSVHPGSVDAHYTGLTEGYTLYNWKDLFTGTLAKVNLWTPLWNTVLMSALSCVFAIIYGGIFAYIVTRTNMPLKKYLSSIFIFPYLMPQWTLAVVWQNLFSSRLVTGTSDGLLAAAFGVRMPLWWCHGLFPCVVVLGLHYASFAYILISGIFRNMDANLEEAATIMGTPRMKTFFRVTLPMVKPAVLSTILLVFSSSMGSYPVPHYLQLTTLCTKYVQLGDRRIGEASILAVIMIFFGVVILVLNQRTIGGRKRYTTVTGKSGQVNKINLGKAGKHVIALILVIVTLLTGILPIVLFAVETFLPNPGDYSFLRQGIAGNLTTKWWLNSDGTGENGMYGQKGILFNTTLWNSFKGTIIVAVACALIAGTIGLLVGYCVAKNRRSKFARYVNDIAFLPYLMPSLAVGVAFFIFGSSAGIFNTYTLLILAGTIKYIPFASRASLNSMLQLSNEIEEAALIQNVPWYRRMIRILIPIQKSSIISGYMLPFMTCIRELTLFMLLCSQTKIVTTMLDYFDEMGLYAFSSGINLILIVFILLCDTFVNRMTGAGVEKGMG